jgi:hypothetical protein
MEIFKKIYISKVKVYIYPFFKDYHENILGKNENFQTYFKCFLNKFERIKQGHNNTHNNFIRNFNFICNKI